MTLDRPPTSPANAPRLSVLTVSHNDAPGLARTLESLRPLAEAWPPDEWEHVVVDGSPEVNRWPLAGLGAGWPLIHVEEPPLGVPHAFNRGLVTARGAALWFLNGGDALRDLAALVRAVLALEGDGALDFVCGGAYLTRNGAPLYPVVPWRSLLANIVGRNWIYHQSMIYRRAALARVGLFSDAYRTALDYDYHVRCYLAGLRGRFTADVLVDYDMGGASNDVAAVFREVRRIQRAHRARLPAWVNGANEIVRRVEYAGSRACARCRGRRSAPACGPAGWSSTAGCAAAGGRDAVRPVERRRAAPSVLQEVVRRLLAVTARR